MLREPFDELGDFLLLEVLLDEGEEVLFDLEPVLVLHFKEGVRLDMISLKVVDHRMLAVEEFAGDGGGVNHFFE